MQQKKKIHNSHKIYATKTRLSTHQYFLTFHRFLLNFFFNPRVKERTEFVQWCCVVSMHRIRRGYAKPLRRVQGLCAWDAPWGGKKKTSFNWISNCNSSGSLASECECRTQTTRRHSSCEWMNWAWQSGVHRADVVEGGTLRTVLKGSLLAFWWLTETRWTRARHLANRYAPLQSLILAGCDSGLYSLDTDAQTFGGLHCSSWDFMGTHNHLMSQFIKIHQIFSNYSKFS